MTLLAFNHTFDLPTKKLIASQVLASLSAVESITIGTTSYDGSKQLANMLQNMDDRGLIHTIHVNRYSVMAVRNNSDQLAFTAEIVDHVTNSKKFWEDYFAR